MPYITSVERAGIEKGRHFTAPNAMPVLRRPGKECGIRLLRDGDQEVEIVDVARCAAAQEGGNLGCQEGDVVIDVHPESAAAWRRQGQNPLLDDAPGRSPARIAGDFDLYSAS